MYNALSLLLMIVSLGCSNHNDKSSVETGIDAMEYADVVSILASGNENAYVFNVGVKSPDLGCEQYVDWWEVVSENGDLIYRRILLHSHVGEQPFVRSGGPFDIAADTKVWVRAHMNTTGYGGKAFFGSLSDGFNESAIEPNFALDLEKVSPQPTDCAF